MCAGRLKSNFLFHKTIWRSLVCTSWPGRWRIVTIAIILFFDFPPTKKIKKKKGFLTDRNPVKKKKTILLGHGPSNNSHNTPALSSS